MDAKLGGNLTVLKCLLSHYKGEDPDCRSSREITLTKLSAPGRGHYQIMYMPSDMMHCKGHNITSVL